MQAEEEPMKKYDWIIKGLDEEPGDSSLNTQEKFFSGNYWLTGQVEWVLKTY